MAYLKVSGNRSRATQRTNAYWTPERMKGAIPLPLKTVSRDEMDKLLGGDGVSQVVRGSFPSSTQTMAATTSEVADYEKPPYSCVGKLYMREGSVNYVGSAWLIGKKAIFSAAHCLFDDNDTFYDDVIFVPQYKNGREPKGQAAVVQIAIDSRYNAPSGSNHDLRFDMGVAILDQPIGDPSNGTGFVNYLPMPKTLISIGNGVSSVGYPARSPFGGEKMMQSSGEVVSDASPGTDTERYWGAENDMTQGCSGGPIFSWSQPGGVAIGLNSFKFTDDNGTMYSPYFGDGFVDLIDWAKDNGGDLTTSVGSVGGGDSISLDELRDLRRKAKATLEGVESLIQSLS